MAIELLNSAMTYQAQPSVQQTKTIQNAEADNMDIPASEQAGRVDLTTAKIAGTDKKDNQGRDGSSSAEHQQANNDQIKKAIEKLNKNMSNSEAIFGIHEETHRVMIKIVDKDTKELIKEFPPEKTLDMIAKAWELAGILVDEKR